MEKISRLAYQLRDEGSAENLTVAWEKAKLPKRDYAQQVAIEWLSVLCGIIRK